jgi:uncharacterized membrane protein YhhN
LWNLRRPSLLRGNILVLGSFVLAFRLSGFPASRTTLLLLIPAALAAIGMADTLRCLPRRRNLYLAGIILYLFMDMLVLCLIFFFLLMPYVMR